MELYKKREIEIKERPRIIKQVNRDIVLIKTDNYLTKVNLRSEEIANKRCGTEHGCFESEYKSIDKFVVPKDCKIIFVLKSGSVYHSDDDIGEGTCFWDLEIISLNDFDFIKTLDSGSYICYQGDKDRILEFSVTENCEYIAVVRDSNDIDFYSYHKWKKKIYTINFGERISNLDFHPQLPVAFAANDKNVWLWEIKSGNLLKELSFEYIYSLMFSRKSNDLLIAYKNNSSKAVQIFDIDKLEKKSEITLSEKFNLEKIALHPSGRYVAIDGDKRICLFDTRSKEEVSNMEIGEKISAINFDLKGDNIFAGTDEGKLLIIALKR